MGSRIGAGTGACSSLSGVLNLTRGLRWDPPLVRTIAVVGREHRGRAGLTEMEPGHCKMCNCTEPRPWAGDQGTANGGSWCRQSQ